MNTLDKIKELERRYDNRTDDSTPVDVSKDGAKFFIETEAGWEPINRNEVADTIGDEKSDAIWHWAHK